MPVTIKDIYAGKLDARDEANGATASKFIESFVIPPGLSLDDLLNGNKHLVSGYKGVGKTSVLYYLRQKALELNAKTCVSFIEFKSGFEEVDKSAMEKVAKRLTALVDVSGEIQPNKVEYLHIWRWVFFRKVVDDSKEHSCPLFQNDNNWKNFVKEVGKIASQPQGSVLSLKSLRISTQIAKDPSVSGEAEWERVSKSNEALEKLTEIVDNCERLFKRLKRNGDTPYYIMVDEMEAFYNDHDLFTRDLTLIRDMLFTIHRINGYGKLHIIAAIRNELINAMDRFISTNEVNKVIEGFEIPIKWSYSNTTSEDHPIICVLMRRISMACGSEQRFSEWFPDYISGKEAVNYILDNSWNKPRDIVRLLIAAQNDNLHCNDSKFTQAAFDTLRIEYSRNSLREIRLELQALYTSKEINMVIAQVRGGSRFFTLRQLEAKIKGNAPKGSEFRKFWEARKNDILQDFYRIGFWGNVKRFDENGQLCDRRDWRWQWYHKGNPDLLTEDRWELTIHNALFKELSIDLT